MKRIKEFFYSKFYIDMIFSGVLIFLFILRWTAMFTSPDKKRV